MPTPFAIYLPSAAAKASALALALLLAGGVVHAGDPAVPGTGAVDTVTPEAMTGHARTRGPGIAQQPSDMMLQAMPGDEPVAPVDPAVAEALVAADRVAFAKSGAKTPDADLTLWFDAAHTQVERRMPTLKGRYQGVATLYYENGRLRESSTWVEGRQHGMLRNWREDGTPEAFVTMMLDRVQGEVTVFRSDGSIEETAIYVDDQRHGLTCKYDVTGKVTQKLNFSEGVLDGEERRFFADGRLHKLLHWKRGVQDGLEAAYTRTGQKVRERLWRDGEPVGPTRYWDETGAPLPPDDAAQATAEPKPEATP